MALQIITNKAKQRLVQYKDEFLAANPNIEKNEDGSAKYTDSQWLDEVVKRWLQRQLFNGDKKLKEKSIEEKEFDLNTD